MSYQLKSERITYKCLECQHEQYIGTYCLKCQQKNTLKVYQRCKKCHQYVWGENGWINGGVDNRQMKCKTCETERRLLKKQREKANGKTEKN